MYKIFNWAPLLNEGGVDVVKCMQPTTPVWVMLKALYKANTMSIDIYMYMDNEAVKMCIDMYSQPEVLT